MDRIYTATARSTFQQGSQLRQLLQSSGHHNLHLARLGITDPTLQPASSSFPVDKPAEANSLNAAFDNVMPDHNESGLCPGEIGALGRINANLFSFVDERGHLNHETSL
jgi:hypothetical protein